MTLSSWFKLMVFGTITALIYTHMQMQIVELAYKGKEKQHRIHDLVDNNGVLTHQILALKSASNLGRKLLANDESLQFMGHDKVMTFVSPNAPIPAQPTPKTKIKAEIPMLNWLSFLSIPEAKAFDN